MTPNGEATALYGREGVLDSLGLMSIVTGLEEAIEDQSELLVTLADDKALSRKTSPFRTVGTLADFAWEVTSEQIKNV